jgi:hypothetical protein
MNNKAILSNYEGRFAYPDHLLQMRLCILVLDIRIGIEPYNTFAWLYRMCQ